MRSVIVGGGTGGHIYPALAVATSLRARPDAPELSWIGGHRGLEGTIVPPTGIPLRRLALRSLRTTELDAHVILDPLRLGASVPQAAALLARLRPAAIFTTGGYVAIPVLLAAAPLGIPVVLWDGNVVPGRAVRATARLADVLAVSFERDLRDAGRGRAGRALLRDRARRSATRAPSTARRHGRGWPSRTASGSCSSSAGRRRSAGSTPRCRAPSAGWSSG